MLIGPIEMEISVLISVLAWIPRNKPPPLSAILQDFQNKENRFQIQKSRIRLAEKPEEEKEH